MPDLSGKLAIVTGTRRSSDTFPDDEKARGMGAAGDEHPHENDRHRKRHRQHHCLTLLQPSPLDQRPIHQHRPQQSRRVVANGLRGDLPGKVFTPEACTARNLPVNVS